MRSEHTPYEWAMQKAAEKVEPLGDLRADMREAANTVRLVRLEIEMSEQQAQAEADYLRNYLEVNQPEDRVVMPEEAERIKQGVR